MSCDIGSDFQWPFCELALRLSEGEEGVDLRRFDTLKLHINSDGPEKSHQLRVFLRNFNPAYSKNQAAAHNKAVKSFDKIKAKLMTTRPPVVIGVTAVPPDVIIVTNR